MPHGFYCFLPLLSVVLLAAPTSATTRRVPSEYPTIQAAIGAAASMDTVLVAPGTYSGPGNWDITFSGKHIVLLSEAGPTTTIIDALSGTAGNHRVFYLGFSGPTTSRIDGFTITGGRHCSSGAAGAGLACGGGVPTIANCVFRDNWVGCSDPEKPSKTAALGCGMGGAIYIGSASWPVRIEDCIIEQNGGYCVAGAVALVEADDVTFERCLITRNRQLGVLVRQDSRCTFINCTIANTAITPEIEDYGFGFSVWSGSVVTLDRSIVWANCSGVYNDGLMQATCSLIDTSRIGGAGTLELDGWNSFADPLFCDPNACPQWAIPDPGDYRVQGLSAALPENNPCGVLIGALGSCAPTSIPAGQDLFDESIWASPNPFSSSTALSLGTPLNRDATIAVFDVAGRRVREFRMTQAMAPVVWDGADDNGQRVAPGTYLLRLDGRQNIRGRVTIVR